MGRPGNETISHTNFFPTHKTGSGNETTHNGALEETSGIYNYSVVFFFFFFFFCVCVGLISGLSGLYMFIS